MKTTGNLFEDIGYRPNLNEDNMKFLEGEFNRRRRQLSFEIFQKRYNLRNGNVISTLAYIGDEHNGITRERVRQLVQKALLVLMDPRVKEKICQ